MGDVLLDTLPLQEVGRGCQKRTACHAAPDRHRDGNNLLPHMVAPGGHGSRQRHNRSGADRCIFSDDRLHSS